MESWRLLPYACCAPGENMALDAAILSACDAGRVPPTVRFYGWSRPAVSLGRRQDLKEINLAVCREAGWEVVRRITGGRAVLHNRELTYSLSASVEHPLFTGGLLNSYRRINRCLLNGFARLGIKGGARPAADKNYPGFSANCFASLEPWEIAIQGKKVIGSAQRRNQHAFIQHGSIFISFDALFNARLFSSGEEADILRVGDLNRATIGGLDEFLTEGISPSRLADILQEELERGLGIDLHPGKLTPEEADLRDELKAGMVEFSPGVVEFNKREFDA